MNNPAISVVIATRNRPEMLRAAVAGVLGQTYEGPINCIIVFDRVEPDESLIRSNPDRSVHVVPNERSGGLAGARNTGIMAATGDYVAFCDDDDVWLPTKVEKQMTQIGSADTSVTGITIDYGGRTKDRVPRKATFTLDNLVQKRLMEAHPSSVLIRRSSLLGSIGLVDEDIPGSYGEDFDLIIRALQAGSVSVVEEPLVRVHWGQSLFSRDWGTIIDAIDYLVNKHAVLRTDRKALARLYGRRAFACAASNRRKESLRTCLRTFRLSPVEKRVYVTMPVALGLVGAETLMNIAHRRGHGI